MGYYRHGAKRSTERLPRLFEFSGKKIYTVHDRDDVYDTVMENGLDISNVNYEKSTSVENVEKRDIYGGTTEVQKVEAETYIPRRERLRPTRAIVTLYWSPFPENLARYSV